jgi:hypothetical protein
MENIDLDLKQYLKNWADHQPLPVGGRAQLIAAAASLQKNIGNKSTLKISEKSNDLISWAMVYCVDRRISIARLVT